MPTNANGSQLSGYTYVAAVLRSPDTVRQKNIVALIIRDRADCNTHPEDGREQGDVPTICTECAESWSWDYDLMFFRTVGGRAMAQKMGLDPMTAGEVLREKDGYERRMKEAKVA